MDRHIEICKNCHMLKKRASALFGVDLSDPNRITLSLYADGITKYFVCIKKWCPYLDEHEYTDKSLHKGKIFPG